ncbi:MAG: DUF5654 family protein [Candidatus Pacebacteria bacterium]|nr:DUF5654 family protein [Candidatus Paceibacterota bacterium]
MANIETPDNIQDLPLAIVRNMITLATSGFGVVVALAWNEAIKGAVKEFISPYLGESGGVISLAIYALIMTILAVIVTMQLSQIEKRLVDLNELMKNKSRTIKPKETSKKVVNKTTK